MNIDWDQLGEFMAHWRRSGSTTALKEAAKNHGAVLVAHNEEYAKQIGGVSQKRIEHWSRGMDKAPIFFDNGVVIKMVEDFMQTRASLNLAYGVIEDIEFQFAQMDKSFNERVARAIDARSIDRRLPNAIVLGRLLGNPALTKREPINEMKFYLERGWPLTNGSPYSGKNPYEID